MDDFVQDELARLKGDYIEVVGTAFQHFYCPILFRDEPTELCGAHILNEAFEGVDRTRTVQRKDVDNFYGSHFEADYIDIKMRDTLNALELMTDPAVAKRFNAKVFLDGSPVQHFFKAGAKPSNSVLVRVAAADPTAMFGLKLGANHMESVKDGRWEVEVSRDLRLPFLVSAIKAAHLTLFKLLGYRYALSSAGAFTGWSILGQFFLQHCKTPKRKIAEPARQFFSQFIHLVRPVIHTDIDLKGTVTDGRIFICKGASVPRWAFIVFVRAGDDLHGVMIPTLETPEQAETFYGFLGNSNTSIQVAIAEYAGEHWNITPETRGLEWNKNASLSW